MAIDGFGGDAVRHDDDDPIWGMGASREDGPGREEYLELLGGRLRAGGVAHLGRFRRLTDYVNLLEGFFTLRAVSLLDRTGDATRVTMPELRVRLDDVAIIGQLRFDPPPPAAPEDRLQVEKVKHRLVILTRSHLVAGDVHIHADSSILHFVDSNDPRFIPMADVRVRWLEDHEIAARYPFALVQRSQIQGVATEGLGGAGEADAARDAAQREAAASAEVMEVVSEA